MALALDKTPLLELEGKTWVHLGFVVLLQVLLVFVYLVLLRFIRHHLRTQERLEVAERHAELGRFAGVLAHEIKNPLSSLRGLLAFARQKEQDAVLREVQDKSLDEVDRLNRIADDFLTYGKETVLDLEEVALLPLVRRALELVHYEMENKGLACDLRGDDFTVSADGDRLLQVLVNLLLNAAQAAPPGGRVELAFDAARRSLKIANPVAEPVTATAEQLFAPFYSTRSQGSGLGLAIARKLLEAHGFSVRLTATAPFTLLLEFSHDPS
nr:ATP-binding protein [Desulfuromonas sp. KJ2020]